MANRLQSMALPDGGGVTPFIYTPGEVKPIETPNVGLLSQAIDAYNERQTKMSDAIGNVHFVLGQMRDKMHKDEETARYMKDYEDNIVNTIRSYAQMGDISGALNNATLLAKQVTSDGNLQDRIKANEEYTKLDDAYKQKVKEGKISQEHYDWWKRNGGEFKFKEFKDTNNNPIGGKLDTLTPLYDDFDWENAFFTAFKFNNPDSYSNRSSSTVAGGGYNDEETTSFRRSGGSSYSHKKVTPEQIIATMKQYLGTGERYKQVYQMFEVERDSFGKDLNELLDLKQKNNRDDNDNKRLQELESSLSLKRTMYDNDVVDFDNYILYNYNNSNYKNSLAYTETATGSESTSESSKSPRSSKESNVGHYPSLYPGLGGYNGGSFGGRFGSSPGVQVTSGLTLGLGSGTGGFRGRYTGK